MTTPLERIVVLGTGGTISCTHTSSGDLIPTLSTADIVAHAGVSGVECRDLIQLDSSDITLADIDSLVRAISTAINDGATGIILLHGTDTMEETAMVVHRFFSGTIPIALTGAQRPADDPNPDGPQNIRDAVETLNNAAGTPDVLVVFGGHTLSAYGATKRHTTDDRAFSHSYEGTRPDRLAHPAPLAELNVPIVTMFAGADARIIPRGQNIDGLVIAALGSGNIPSPVAQALSELDCPVIICTRVPEGSVHFVYGGAGGGAELERQGFRSGGSLRPSQARMELLCELAVQRTASSPTQAV